MAVQHGLMYPRTPTGAAGVVPSPPWHYSGEMLTVEYRTDPANVARVLPDELRLADDDPGAVAIIWADWQSCSDSFDELLDPARSQYKEVFAVVRCTFEGVVYSRCVFIWVDKDFAMARGHLQGYPKKLGDIWLTRPVAVGRAGPRLEPGGRFGATVSTFGRRIAEAQFTITRTAESAGFVNGHPMIHSRQFPSVECDGTDSLDELVTFSGYDTDLGPVYAGDASLALHDTPTEEIAALPVEEIIGGFYRQVGTSWRGGTTLTARPNPLSSRERIVTMTSTWVEPYLSDLGPDDADITDHDTYVNGVPHATFARLRREDPVSWWDEADGAGFWSVARRADALLVSRNHETFTSTRGIRLEEMAAEELAQRCTMMELDPPEHSRLRRLVARGFTRRVVWSYEEGIRTLAGAVLDEALPKGRIDFVHDVAEQLPMRMLGRLLGTPERDGDQLVHWGDALLGNTDPEFTTHVVDQTDTDEFRFLPFRSPAAIEIFRYAERQAAERRAKPGDDVISQLLAPTVDGEPLTDLEFKNFFDAPRGRRQRHHPLHHGPWIVDDDEPSQPVGAMAGAPGTHRLGHRGDSANQCRHDAFPTDRHVRCRTRWASDQGGRQGGDVVQLGEP